MTKMLATVFLGAALSAAAGLAAPQEQQQPNGEKKEWTPQKPGPEHEALRPFEGRWDADIRHCARHGDSEASKGTESVELRLGGFWLFSDFASTMKNQPFQGHAMLGYDQNRKRYVSTWCSSSSSDLVLFEGDYDKASKTLTMKADCVGPDGKPMKLQTVQRVVDPDHTEFRLVALGADDGKDCPCMTIHYSRRR